MPASVGPAGDADRAAPRHRRRQRPRGQRRAPERDEQRFVVEQQEAFELEGRLQATVGAALAFAFVVTSGALKKLRMVEAFQRLNKRIWALHWPLPSPDRIQEQLASFNVFGKADMWSFFYQIALDADCTPLTAVNFAGRIREWLVVPLGIKTAPSWAQRVLSAVLDKHSERWTVIVYIDDVLIGAVDSAAFIEACVVYSTRMMGEESGTE